MDFGQEYEQYARRAAFEALLAGDRPGERCRVLDLEEGRQYAMARFAVPPGADRLRDALTGHFLKYPEYTLLGWDAGEYLVIIKAEPGDLDRCVSRCVKALRENYEALGGDDWHAAISPGVDSPLALAKCYETVSRFWAHRYFLPGEHLLTRQTVGRGVDEEEQLQALTAAAADPRCLRELLERGSGGEVPGFVSRLLEELAPGLGSDSFCRYLALSTRFTALGFVEERGVDHQSFIRTWGLALPGTGRITPAVLEAYMVRVLQAAVRCRDGNMADRCRGVLRQAADYISAHFNRQGLSLDQVAAAVGLSPNYLSALFRREMGCTFVAFLTDRRMERARELLETTDLRSGQVAHAVGYRDPRYFSSLFKKTQGMTPREYRADKKSADG